MELEIGKEYVLKRLHIQEMDHFIGYNDGEIVKLVSLDDNDNTALVIKKEDMKPLWHSQRELKLNSENV